VARQTPRVSHRFLGSIDDPATGAGQGCEFCLSAFARAADQRARVAHLFLDGRVTPDHHGEHRFGKAARGFGEGIFLVAADFAAVENGRRRLVVGQCL